MATLQIAVRGIRRVIREIERSRRDLERLEWRVATRSARDISRLLARNIQREIDDRTRRRTGSLRRVTIKTIRDRRNGIIRFRPQFLRTAYRTPPGRGRPGASKIGQYAFVVNHSKQFIQAAISRTEGSAELYAILRKHLAFIINEIEQGR